MSSLTNEQAEAIFVQLEKTSRLRELNINQNDLSSMNPKLFYPLAHMVEDLDISWCSLTTEQSLTLFTEIETLTHRNIFQLKYLDIQGNDLSKLEPELLGKAIVELDEINLCVTSLTKKQLAGIFKAIDGATNLLLKIMTIGDEDLNKIPKSLANSVQDKIELLVVG